MKTRLILPLFLLGIVNQAMMLAQSAGTFTATGSMTTARSGHSAILLTDGRVLIAGGGGSSGATFVPTSSAELYNSATGTFTATPWSGEIPAALLADGRVLVFGDGTGAELSTIRLQASSRLQVTGPHPGASRSCSTTARCLWLPFPTRNFMTLLLARSPARAHTPARAPWAYRRRRCSRMGGS